jgi:hypothetical protein
MPRIPVRQRQVGFPNTGGVPQIPQGQNPFAGQEAFGRTIETTGGALLEKRLQENERYDEEQDVLAVLELERNFADQERVFHEQEDSKEGALTNGSRERAEEYYRKAEGEYTTRLGNDNQRQIWTRRFYARREAGLDRRARNESQQHQVRKKEAMDGALLTATKDAGTFATDVTWLDQLVSRYGATVDALRTGHDNAILKQAGADTVYSSAFMQLMNNDNVTSAGDLLKKIKDKVSPDTYRQMKGSYEGEMKRIKAEEKNAARESLGDIRKDMQDEEASVLSTGYPLNKDVLKRVRMAEEKEVLPKGTARDYDNRIKAAQDAFYIMNETRTEPFSKRIDLAKSRIAPKPGEPGFAEKKQRYDMVIQYLQNDEKLYQKDPMAYLQPAIQRRLDKAISAGQLKQDDQGGQARAAIEIGVALQEQRGGGPVRILSDQQKDQLITEFMKADPDGKLAMAQQWESVFGDRFGQVLSETKLETGYAVAGQLATDPASRPLARVLMQVADRPDSDFDTGEVKKSDIKNEVRGQFDGSAYGQVLTGLSSAFPDDAALTAYANGFRTLVYKAAMHYVETGMDEGDAVKRVMEQLNTLYGTVADDDLGFVLFPKTANAGAIESGLAAARDQVSQGLNQQLGAMVREGAIWRNDGDDFILVFQDNADRVLFGSEVSGYVTDANGIPIRISAADAEAIGSGQRTTEQVLTEAVNRTLPWRQIAKEKLPPEQVKRPGVEDLSGIMTRAAIKYDVPVALIQAVLETESGGNRWATSDQGARGLMQIMPETGARYGLNTAMDFYDPIKNVDAGVRYLRDLLIRYDGDEDKAIAAYHQGEATVDQGLDAIGPKGRNYLNVVKSKYSKGPIVELKGKKPIQKTTGDYSMPIIFSDKGEEVVIPTVINGKTVDTMDAIDYYIKTGEYIKKFKNIKEARKYVDDLNKNFVSANKSGRYKRLNETSLPGPVVPGNINLTNRPIVKNKDGTVSTELSMSFNEDGLEILIPTIINGKKVSPEKAIEHYHQTGEHLGKFESVKAANEYADMIHRKQEKRIKVAK